MSCALRAGSKPLACAVRDVGFGAETPSSCGRVGVWSVGVTEVRGQFTGGRVRHSRHDRKTGRRQVCALSCREDQGSSGEDRCVGTYASGAPVLVTWEGARVADDVDSRAMQQ